MSAVLICKSQFASHLYCKRDPKRLLQDLLNWGSWLTSGKLNYYLGAWNRWNNRGCRLKWIDIANSDTLIVIFLREDYEKITLVCKMENNVFSIHMGKSEMVFNEGDRSWTWTNLFHWYYYKDKLYVSSPALLAVSGLRHYFAGHHSPISCIKHLRT